ncbi:MAG: DUF2807 domain-containing protein [Saprospirales bacterium]|nr:DUF2807 domain-containing protein [Saprospirales bacterium]
MRSISVMLTFFALFQIHVSAQNTATRSVSSFAQLAVAGGFDQVILQEGSVEMVRIETKNGDPDNVITEVKGSTLGVRMKKGSYNSGTYKLVVTYRQLEGVSSSGSTDIEAVSTIRGDKFELSSSGSGNFKGTFDVKKLQVAISGSSDMKLAGRAEKQEIAISGSGDIDAGALSGSAADVAISGSGDVKLHVDGPVQTSVSGSGNVHNY